MNKIIPPFWHMLEGTAVIPKMYWDVYDQEQRIKLICERLEKLAKYANGTAEVVNLHSKQIEELATLFEKFQASGFDDYYKAQIKEYIETHMLEIWQTFARQVFFGLTLDGHFVAYVPESWEEIQFDTGAVYGTDEYGRLILTFDVDSPHHVMQP